MQVPLLSADVSHCLPLPTFIREPYSVLLLVQHFYLPDVDMTTSGVNVHHFYVGIKKAFRLFS